MKEAEELHLQIFYKAGQMACSDNDVAAFEFKPALLDELKERDRVKLSVRLTEVQVRFPKNCFQNLFPDVKDDDEMIFLKVICEQAEDEVAFLGHFRKKYDDGANVRRIAYFKPNQRDFSKISSIPDKLSFRLMLTSDFYGGDQFPLKPEGECVLDIVVSGGLMAEITS